MNRVLSLPHTPIFAGLLEGMKAKQRRTIVTEKGMIRFEMPLGPVEMKFSSPQHQLAPGTEVVVWWSLGGFVCAPAAEIESEQRATREVTERVHVARAQLAAARAERRARLAAHCDLVIDEVETPLRAL